MYLNLFLYLLIGFLSFIFGLFSKSFFPKYMEKKAENLATKEDIEEITNKTEEVKNEFNKEFGKFSKKLEFKYRFAEEQLVNLYSNLYSIVSQSEYFRYFLEHYDNLKLSFNTTPFLEINQSIHNLKIDLSTGKILVDEIIRKENEITKANKMNIANEIIENSKYANKRLLKLAVAYRYVHDCYSDGTNENLKEKYKYDIEEVKLIGAIITIIIKEYNRLACELDLDYSKYELEHGMFEKTEFDVSDIYIFDDSNVKKYL